MLRHALLSASLLLTLACGPMSQDPDGGRDAGAVVDAGVTESTLVMNTRPRGECGENVGVLTPYIPDELGHWSGTRLAPPTAPFVVDAIEYDTYTDDVPGCDVTLAHRVRLYRVPRGTALPSAPSSDGGVVAEYLVGPTVGTHTPALTGRDGGFRGERISLPVTGVTLAAQEDLIVSVEFVGNADRTAALCLFACPTNADAGVVTRSGLDYWSNAAAEPYTWLDLHADFMSEAQLTVRMRGH